jgi:sigma-E factor negative regulatory protein RseB
MRIAPLFRCLGMLTLLFPSALAASDEQAQVLDVQTLFAKMSRVSHVLNYQGSFTYEHKDSPSLQGFRLAHWVVDGVEYERLQYLSGPEREIVRSGRELSCSTPRDQLLQGRLRQAGTEIARLDELYHFQTQYVERVAGRLTSVLQVAPRDIYRYGYLLSVDQETGLILKSLMVDANKRVLERLQFLDLELNPDIAELEQLPAARRQHIANPEINECNQTEAGEPENWRLSWVPAGFVFVGQQQINDRDMLMYTDGLANFSVFIEPTTNVPPEGVGQRGATSLFMSKVMRDQQLHRVSVVGEIPTLAAEQIALGLEPETEAAP